MLHALASSDSSPSYIQLPKEARSRCHLSKLYFSQMKLMFRHITELLPCNASLTAKLQTLLPLIQELCIFSHTINVRLYVLLVSQEIKFLPGLGGM